MMKNFLYGICGFPGDFTIKNREEKCVEHIKERVGDQKVLVMCFKFIKMLLSGCPRNFKTNLLISIKCI